MPMCIPKSYMAICIPEAYRPMCIPEAYRPMCIPKSYRPMYSYVALFVFLNSHRPIIRASSSEFKEQDFFF